MAESLGSAVLTLSLDSEPLKAGLEAARKVIEKANFSIKINTGGAEQRFQQLEASAKTLETQLKKLQSTPLNLNTRQLARLGGDFAAAGKELNDYTRAIINGDKPLANNIAALQQQSVAFRTLAANVKIGSAEFTNFTQAAAKASQKQLFAGLEQAAALQKLFSQGRGEGGFDSFRGTEDLLAFASKIGQTPAAIALYTQALEQARDVTKFSDSNFAKLTAEIERQTQALRAAFTAARNYNSALGSGRPALPPAQGPAPFTLQAPTPAEIQAAARAARRQSRIEGIRDYLSTGGRDRSVLTGTTAFARPNSEAIRSEQTLQKERLKTADITLRSAKADRAAGQSTGAGRLERAKGIASNALIGGAFPLLFGQGLGASAGGALGGGLGGALGGQFGFGLSLVGTALGAQFDLAIQKSQTLAKALEDPIGSFGELQQAALLSSKSLEKSIASLIAQGREAEAAAKIQLDLATTYGDTTELDGLRSAYDDLGRAFNQLSILTAKYVAGPLTDFLNKLASSFNAFSARSLFEERVAGASPEIQAQARARVRSAAGELSGSGLSLSEVAPQAYAAGMRFLDERLGKTKEIQAAEAAVALAIRRQGQLTSLTNSEIEAQVQGYDLLSLKLQKQRVEVQRLQDIAATPANTEAIDLKASEDQLRLEAQINKLVRDRQAQLGLETAQNAIKAQSIAEQVRNTQALAAAEKGVERQTLATIQAVQSGIAEAKRREQELGAQIDAARLRGGDAGEQEAFRLVEQQKLAANETRLELEKGALSLKEAGEQLRDNIRTGVLEFTRIRSDPQGLNRFLNPQQINDRAQRDFQTLLPSFREAQARFTQLTGARAPEFSGSTSGVNESIRNFIQAVSREFDSTKDLNASLRAASDINAQLISVNTQLASVTQALADKRWDVNLILPNGSSVPYQNEQNAAFPL